MTASPGPPDAREALEIERLRAVLTRAFPELSGGTFTLLTAGWDCIAVDVDDRLIFKFPRHAAAAETLAREVRLLAAVRPAVTLTVPHSTLHGGPAPFSRHPKIAGEHLLARHYEALTDRDRDRLAADMALFYAQLHRLDRTTMEAAGATPIQPWLPGEDILRRGWPLLPPPLRVYAERTVEAWQALPPDPHGTVYGFFDGHGWNMAFDHARARLNGLYDFGDSGFGPRHQEFIYTNLVSPDLTERIAGRYERLTGLSLDRRRIDLLTGAHRLSELAELADDPTHMPTMVATVAAWAGRSRVGRYAASAAVPRGARDSGIGPLSWRSGRVRKNPS